VSPLIKGYPYCTDTGIHGMTIQTEKICKENSRQLRLSGREKCRWGSSGAEKIQKAAI